MPAKGRFEEPEVQRRFQRLTNWERHQIMRFFGKGRDPEQGVVTMRRLTDAERETLKAHAHPL